MKGMFWRIGVLLLVVLALSACGQVETPDSLAAGEASSVRGGGGVVQQTGQFTEGLVVVGTGTANAEPEVARVTFGVELRGDDPAAIVDEAAQRVDEAIAAAQEMGIAQEDIQTVGYNLWVETLYDRETGTPTGEVVYHVSHNVRVTLRDLDQVGGLLAELVEAGANTISEVSFSVDDPEALAEEARREALNSAQVRAEQMAEGLGIALGEPILVMETGGGVPLPVERGLGGGAEVAAPSISPGTFSVSVSVQVVFEIR